MGVSSSCCVVSTGWVLCNHIAQVSVQQLLLGAPQTSTPEAIACWTCRRRHFQLWAALWLLTAIVAYHHLNIFQLYYLLLLLIFITHCKLYSDPDSCLRQSSEIFPVLSMWGPRGRCFIYCNCCDGYKIPCLFSNMQVKKKCSQNLQISFINREFFVVCLYNELTLRGVQTQG